MEGGRKEGERREEGVREELYRVREEGGKREGRDREEGRMVEGKKET